MTAFNDGGKKSLRAIEEGTGKNHSERLMTGKNHSERLMTGFSNLLQNFCAQTEKITPGV